MIGTAASLTVEENLALALRRGQRRRLNRAITENERKLFRRKLAGLELGLEDRLATPAKLLSGGQRQALALLMATLVRPKLALLDEHTASLDPKTALRVLHLTKTLFENEKITTLMITHNMEQALRLGKRLIMLHEGSIILDVNDGERDGLTVSRLVELFHACLLYTSRWKSFATGVTCRRRCSTILPSWAGRRGRRRSFPFLKWYCFSRWSG